MAVTEELRILINSVFNSTGIQQARGQLEKLNALVDSSGRGLTKFKTLETFGNQVRETKIANEWLKRYGVEINKTTGMLTKQGSMSEISAKKMRELGEAIAAGKWRTFRTNIENNRKALKKLGLDTGMVREQFKMYLLSIMFFGMQIQRVFGRIARTSLDTFMKVTEGTTEAGQGINMLQGAFTTLKFAVGEAIAEALLPFIPAILDLIMKIVNFIETHKKLVAAIVIGGAAFGALLFLIGQVGLGISGVATLFVKLGAAIGISTRPLLIFFALGIALLVVFLKAWKDFPETITPLVKGALYEIWGGLKNIWKFEEKQNLLIYLCPIVEKMLI